MVPNDAMKSTEVDIDNHRFPSQSIHRYSSIQELLVSDPTQDWLADRVHACIAALRDDAADAAPRSTRPGHPAGWWWPAPVAAALHDLCHGRAPSATAPCRG
jgi:hypothetical protein